MIWLFVFWLLVMIFGIFAILLVLASGVINYEKKQERKKRQKRIHCIKKGIGTITDVQKNETNGVMTVKVKVDNMDDVWFVDEISPRIDKVKWKGISIGKRYRYPLEVHEGCQVHIQYDPNDPTNGYIIKRYG